MKHGDAKDLNPELMLKLLGLDKAHKKNKCRCNREFIVNFVNHRQFCQSLF